MKTDPGPTSSARNGGSCDMRGSSKCQIRCRIEIAGTSMKRCAILLEDSLDKGRAAAGRGGGVEELD